MTGDDFPQSAAEASDSLLRADLARGAQVIASIEPILRHLLLQDDQSIFSEEIVARTRGMITSLVVHILQELWASGRAEAARTDDEATLTAVLLAVPGLLGHCHARAVEGQLNDRLASQARIDPVTSPIITARLAAPDPEMAALAMKVLTAQARFVQSQRRMDLSPYELPADLLHHLLLALADLDGAHAITAAGKIRQHYDEARSRLGLLARLALGDGTSQDTLLDLAQSGVATFATALSLAVVQDRDTVLLALTDGQQARLATMLAAAGQTATQAEATLALIHPDVPLDRHLLGLGQRHAHDLLAAGGGA